jgi:excisionase family DNA binding protein
MDVSNLMSVGKVAKRLGKSTQWVYTLIKSQKLDAVQIGGFWMVSEHEVDRYLREHPSTDGSSNDSHGRADSDKIRGPSLLAA